MIRILPLALWCLLGALTARPQVCAPVEHEQIAARDLAAFLPAFAQLNPDIPIAPAPSIGANRLFRSTELISLARRYSLDLNEAQDLCFEWPVESLARERILDAMNAALDVPQPRIEILETSRYSVPRGRLEFRRDDLAAPALPDLRTPVLWRGNVIYAGSRKFAVWARVIIAARLPRIVAVDSLIPGRPIAASQIRLEYGDGFPGRTDVARSLDQVIGRVALRGVAPAAEIHLALLAQPHDVKRGDTVEIEVRSGSARLAFTGKSESDGRTGDLIAVRNLRSNKIFHARVDGKDRAVVDARVFQGN